MRRLARYQDFGHVLDGHSCDQAFPHGKDSLATSAASGEPSC